MKIALVFLMCFVSATWQQNSYWSYPQRRLPFYSNNFVNEFQNDYPIVPSDPAQQDYSNYGPVSQRPQLERSLGNIGNNHRYQKPNPRFFGLGYAGLNYLASIILDSLQLSVSFTSTSTRFVTATSTFTSFTWTTCFTSTMFTSSTACRRKRHFSPKMIVGDDSDADNVIASFEDGNKEAISMKELPREGRDIDPALIIQSSQKDEEDKSAWALVPQQSEASVNRYVRQNRQDNVSVVVVTSTLTSYTLVFSSNWRVVTNLAAETVLSCLPNGFRICP